VNEPMREGNMLAECSKRPSSKAAASEGPNRTLWGARCDEVGAPSLCAPLSGEAAGSPLRV